MKSSFSLLTLGFLSCLFVVSSCQDDIDVSKADYQNGWLKGKYSAPLGEAHLTFGEAADKYYEENTDLFGSVRIKDSMGFIFLQYDTTVNIEYSKIELNEEAFTFTLDQTTTLHFDIPNTIPDECVFNFSNAHIDFELDNTTDYKMSAHVDEITSNSASVTYDRTFVVDSKSKISETFQDAGISGKFTSLLNDRDNTDFTASYNLVIGFDDDILDELDGLSEADKKIRLHEIYNSYKTSGKTFPIHFTVIMPLQLGEGSKLVYTDTIRNVDLSDVVDNDQINQAQIQINVNHQIPFGMTIDLTPMDEAFMPVAVVDETKYKNHVIAGPNVDVNGASINEASTDITILYEENMIPELRQTKHFLVNFTSEELDAGKRAYLRRSDKMDLKVRIKTNSIKIY